MRALLLVVALVGVVELAEAVDCGGGGVVHGQLSGGSASWFGFSEGGGAIRWVQLQPGEIYEGGCAGTVALWYQTGGVNTPMPDVSPSQVSVNGGILLAWVAMTQWQSLIEYGLLGLAGLVCGGLLAWSMARTAL